MAPSSPSKRRRTTSAGPAVVVGEHVGDRMPPAVGARDGGPEGGGALEAAADQLAQPDEVRRRGPPFLVACPRPPARVTRSRLSVIFSRRFFSFSPGAASGARPSSEIAERTAAQYPTDHGGGHCIDLPRCDRGQHGL